jgi:hypothetical protein
MVAEQLASAGKTSILVVAPYPPLTISPAKGKINEIQTRIKDFHWTMFKAKKSPVLQFSPWQLVASASWIAKMRKTTRAIFRKPI